MNDEQHLLASAYLDDALTRDERARAEADPDVMATVARLREVRRALSAVEPPDPARRAATIDAALKTFTDELGVAPPLVAPYTRRRTSVWLAGAAAAALILIVAGGILVARRGQGDDTAGGAVTTAGTAQVLSRDEAHTAASTAAPDAATDVSPGAEAAGGATAPTEQGQARTASTNGAAAPAATSLAPPLLTSPEDLTAYAAQPRSKLLDLAAGGQRTCHGGRWLGPAMYVVNGVDTPVQVFLVATAGQVRAVDSATCAVVATAPAP